MTHKHAPNSQLKRYDRKRLLAEAYWDREVKESVALSSGGILQIDRGDVLHDAKGYIHPALE